MDAVAWTVALTLWYIPRMDFDAGENNDGDALGENQDGNLEYREDYGPTFSPSTPPESGRTRRTATPKQPKRKEDERGDDEK